MKKLSYIILGAMLLLCSCEKELRFNGSYDGQKLVLYSCANPDTVLTAYIFRSTFFLARDDEKGDQREGLSGARVSALVNGKDSYAMRETVSIIEYPSISYDPDTGLYHEVTLKKKRICYVSDYQPAPGDHIKVMASMEGLKDVYGETVVPERPSARVESHAFRQTQNYPADRMQFKLELDDRAGENNYYSLAVQQNCFVYDWETDSGRKDWAGMRLFSDDVVFFKTGIEDMIDAVDGTSRLVPQFFDDGSFNGMKHSFNLWCEVNLMDEPVYGEDDEHNTYVDHFAQMDIDELDPKDFKIFVVSLSENMYRYNMSLISYEETDGITEVFGEPVSIFNNVVGGIGCVGSLSTSVVTLDQ